MTYMIEKTVEEVALEKGEECLKLFTTYCGHIDSYYKEIKSPLPSESVIEMSLHLLAYWYTGKEELTLDEAREAALFLQRVITFTFKHKKALQTLN